jgi:membrane protein implicated in regulation of membrane protease activity
MLAAYLTALIVGGVLVAVSLAGGDHHDAGGHAADGDGHAASHATHGGEVAGGAGLDALLGWVPLGSLRFWTFFAAFFGLTGTALDLLAHTAPVATAIAATAIGYGAGVALTRVIRTLQRTSSDSSLSADDLVGATARVLVPLAAGRTGKVRLHLKDRTVDLLAETQETVELAAGERALVIAVPRDGRAVVARIDKVDLT